MGLPAVIAKARAGGGRGSGLRLLRRRQPRSRLRAGHRHAGGGRADDARGAAILRGLAGLDMVGGDVVEVAPQYDATTNTAQAAAQVLFTILSLIDIGLERRREG